MQLADLAAKPKLIEIKIDDTIDTQDYKDVSIEALDINLKAKVITQAEYDTQLTEINSNLSLVEEFGNGESINFWTWDRLPLDSFMKLANADETSPSEMIGIVRPLILNHAGKQIMTRENVLPQKLLVAAISKIVEKLGK